MYLATIKFIFFLLRSWSTKLLYSRKIHLFKNRIGSMSAATNMAIEYRHWYVCLWRISFSTLLIIILKSGINSGAGNPCNPCCLLNPQSIAQSTHEHPHQRRCCAKGRVPLSCQQGNRILHEFCMVSHNITSATADQTRAVVNVEDVAASPFYHTWH